MNDLQNAKAQCLADIAEHLPRLKPQLDAIDPRLAAYIEDAISNNGSHCNLYEALGIRKEMRLMYSYSIDTERVQRTLRAIEGVWQNGKHVKGGLMFDTPRGSRHVRLMPYQAWCIFGIYAFRHDVCMERPADGGELLPTEFVNDGVVWDTRRLCSEAHIFQTRKSGKTEFGAAIDFTEACFLGPANAQVHICSPSAKISQTAYEAIKDFAMQVDPTCSNRMGGKYFRMTATGLNWQPGNRMKGKIMCMAAGKTPKDSLYAYIVHADEHGQPGYINGHCDMQAAVETCWGSTGPRREKLLMHTTTAGLNLEGPYRNQLREVERSLLNELEIPLGDAHRTPEDKWFAFLLQLDPWEQIYDLDQLDDPELFKKVNRSIGVTVQPTYYRERIFDARKSDDTRKEVLTKDFNIWQSASITEWIKPDEIRPLQQPVRIQDCKAVDGWLVIAGMDFSKGDDLHCITYLAVRKNTETGGTDFFADIDAWITEKALKESSIRNLYEKWIEEGWLHVSPGSVLQPSLPINRIIDLIENYGISFIRWGFDAYQSKDPINTLKAYLWDAKGVNPDNYVVPVSQTFASYNPAVLKIEAVVWNDPPLIVLSMNPLWPWCFGNCVIAEDVRMNNRKMIKRQPGSDACKVDPIQCLATCFILLDQIDGHLQKTEG